MGSKFPELTSSGVKIVRSHVQRVKIIEFRANYYFCKVKIVRTWVQRGQNYKIYRIYDKLLIFCGVKIVYIINYIRDSGVLIFPKGSIGLTCSSVTLSMVGDIQSFNLK